MIETRVFNDFFSEDLVKAVTQKYVDSGLVYGWKSNISKAYDPGHWNRQIVRQPQTSRYDLTTLLDPHHPELSMMWDKIKKVIGNRSLLRCYVNGYTYGTEGYAHQDERWLYTDETKEKTTETIIIYLNEHWHVDYAGETVIFNDDNDIEQAIIPKFNRMLIFDSTKFHAGRSVSRSCQDLRSVLVFKTDTNPTAVCLKTEETSAKFQFLKTHTDEWEHTGRTLYHHLTNVYQLLKSKNESDTVCNAGLFYLIYGSQSYEYDYDKSQVTRDAVARHIGTEAEELVHQYSLTENRLNSLINNTLGLTPEQQLALCKVEFASLLDQNCFNHFSKELDRLHQKIEALTLPDKKAC